MIIARDLIALAPLQRKNLILQHWPVGVRDISEIEEAEILSNIINSFVDEYFVQKIEQDRANLRGTVLDPENLTHEIELLIEAFLPIAEQKLQNAMPTAARLVRSSQNLYEMSGAVKLAFANKATRNLSTTMGSLWEQIANISPYAINPEIEFGLQIRGIDLIAKNFESGIIEYQQLKTQHNTLTGSQRGRSVSELEIHDNPVFCACFANNSNWTFRHADIPRVSGAEFWSRIGIAYDVVLRCVKQLILDLEEKYVEILESS